MNKNGFFMILLSVIVLTIFVISITVYTDISSRKSIQKRVSTLSEGILSTEENLERQLYVFGFRTVYLMEEDIINNGNPISNATEKFEEAFYNGTYNGQTTTILENSYLGSFQETLKDSANKINAQINISNSTIKIEQEDPWNIKINVTTILYAKDSNNLASWNKTLNTIVYVPIEGFADPLHLLKTNGSTIVNIAKTPYENFVSGGDISNLISQIDNNYFKASTSGPSFIQRLEGDFSSPSIYGIETFVNLNNLTGYPIQEKSVIDYIYFDSSNNPDDCTVTPSPKSWFRLDDEDNHLANYNIVWSSGCPN